MRTNMALDNATFQYVLLGQLSDIAYQVALPKVNRWSKALAIAMRAEVISRTEARLYIPHYWAVYVNDGRRAFSARNTVFLVWFRNPADDPRFSGSTTPERRSQVRRLTPGEWDGFLEDNRKAISEGRQTPMIVARHVGPVSAKKFFDNNGGMSDFHRLAGLAAKKSFGEHIKQSVGKNLNIKSNLIIRL